MGGFFPSTGQNERHLTDAQFVDMRQPDPRFEPLRSCTEPTGASGITPPIGGTPRSPSGGAPQGQP